MSNSKKFTTASIVGLPISIFLFVVFLILKLTGVIDWSWWYVTMPIYLPYLVTFVVLFVTLLIMALAVSLKK